jgi:antitoxin (DNA-binding transcriptional repressor) of toxin-antitoxin stability system
VEVGSYEAKTHLPQLLERVANGERSNAPAAAVAGMREFRSGRKLGTGSLKKMIQEGRR